MFLSLFAAAEDNFGKFFSAVLPVHGDYAPVKLHLLRRI